MPVLMGWLFLIGMMIFSAFVFSISQNLKPTKIGTNMLRLMGWLFLIGMATFSAFVFSIFQDL